MIPIGTFYNPVKYNIVYNMIKFKSSEINDVLLKKIEKFDSTLSKKVKEYIKSDDYVFYMNFSDNKLRALYIFNQEQNDGKSSLKLIKKAYGKDMNEKEKKECVKSVLQSAIDYVSHAKMYTVTLKDVESPVDGKKTTITVKTDVNNAKLSLIMNKIIWFLIPFVVISLIINIAIGGLAGVIGFSYARVGKISIDGVDTSKINKKVK